MLNDEEQKYVCKNCKSFRPAKYSTKTVKSNLDAHLITQHNINIPTERRNLSSMSQIDSDAADTALVYLIIGCFLSFFIVENKYFKDFIQCLNPSYKVPSRKKLRNLIHDLFIEKLEELYSGILNTLS